jgi:hypothetical protein
MTDEDLLYLIGGDGGSLESRPNGDRTQFRRMDLSKRAAVPSDWGSSRAHNHHIRHGHNLSIIARGSDSRPGRSKSETRVRWASRLPVRPTIQPIESKHLDSCVSL